MKKIYTSVLVAILSASVYGAKSSSYDDLELRSLLGEPEITEPKDVKVQESSKGPSKRAMKRARKAQNARLEELEAKRKNHMTNIGRIKEASNRLKEDFEPKKKKLDDALRKLEIETASIIGELKVLKESRNLNQDDLTNTPDDNDILSSTRRR